ncbi:MAG TPA: LPS export ABC transporter permease LptF [Candidatus Binataceae bacterium]|nr:LPS export ABC transporter permease LptF [Candidatus Binataceae bacterium]
MKFPRVTILDRYVGREVFSPFLAGVGLLTFTLVTGRLLKLTDLVVNHGVSLAEVGRLILLIMPGFLELTLGMAMLIGVLMGFGRMSGDQEMTAARACGVSLYRLAVPVMLIAFGVYAVASYFAFSLRPWANAQLHQQLYDLSRSSASAGIREKVFNDDLPGIMLYVDKVSSDGTALSGVLISDSRNPSQQSTIIAQHGTLLPDTRGDSTLRLFDGSIFGSESGTDQSHVTSFRIYDLSLRGNDSFSDAELDPDELALPALRGRIATARAAGKPDYEAETELAAKYTVPIATLLFALLGVSLGLKPARGGHSERFGMSVALFFLYYAIMRVGRTLAERGTLNSFVAMSLPDLVFIVLAVWLFVRAASDRGNQGRGPGDLLWDLVERYERSRAVA